MARDAQAHHRGSRRMQPLAEVPQAVGRVRQPVQQQDPGPRVLLDRWKLRFQSGCIAGVHHAAVLIAIDRARVRPPGSLVNLVLQLFEKPVLQLQLPRESATSESS